MEKESVLCIQKQHLMDKIKEVIDYTINNYENSFFSLRELHKDSNTIKRFKAQTGDYELITLQTLCWKYNVDWIDK